MARIVIASGSGRYADPWHSFGGTSRCVAEILRVDGHTVSITDDVDRALAALDGVDVLIVNAGDPWRNTDAPEVEIATLDAGRSGLQMAIDRGIGILALHNALSSMRDYPLWRSLLGGEWVPGLSMHPDIALTAISIDAESHPITAGIASFELIDERYSWLDLDSGIAGLAEHEFDGRTHPLLWARNFASTRVVVDALGHDARSFEAEAHREIVRRSVNWLIGKI